MAGSKRTRRTPRVKRTGDPNPDLDPVSLDLARATARRAAAFWLMRTVFEELHDGALNAAEAADLLEVLRGAIRLLEGQIRRWREQADLARPGLRRALDDLRIAEIHATAAGARPIRDADADASDALAGACAGPWLDTVASEAQIPLPPSLSGPASVEVEP